MIAGAAVLAMVVTGCANGEDSDGRDEAAGKPTTSSATPPTSGTPTHADADHGKPGDSGDDAPVREGKPVGKSQIDGSGLPKGHPKEVSTYDDVLVVTGQEGGCTKVSAALTSQTEKEVVVMLTHSEPPKDTMCTMDIRFPKLVLKLDAPLGDREVVLKSDDKK